MTAKFFKNVAPRIFLATSKFFRGGQNFRFGSPKSIFRKFFFEKFLTNFFRFFENFFPANFTANFGGRRNVFERAPFDVIFRRKKKNFKNVEKIWSKIWSKFFKNRVKKSVRKKSFLRGRSQTVKNRKNLRLMAHLFKKRGQKRY